jgi:outer membrane lipoprotein-sorting protein
MNVDRAVLGRSCLLSLLGALVSPMVACSSDLQDASVIVSGHLDACGGPARLRAVSAIRETGTVTLTDGQSSSSGAFILEEKRPNKSRLERNIAGASTVRAYDGSTAWAITPDHPQAEVLQGERAHDLAENDFDSVFVDTASRGITIELVGIVPVGQVSAYKLKVTKRGEARYSYLDTASFLEIRREYLKEGHPTSYQLYREHRAVAGVTRPTVYEIGREGDQRRMIVNVAKVEISPDIPDDRFRLPR